jgi:hypothetical protein
MRNGKRCIGIARPGRLSFVEQFTGSSFPASNVSYPRFTGRTRPCTQALAEMTNSSYRLFIDDIRDPVSSSWVIARASADAIALLETRGCPFEISFDHDLGGADTAMVVVKRLIEMDLDAGGHYIPNDFTFSVHSANPVGRENIARLLHSYLRHRARRD